MQLTLTEDQATILELLLSGAARAIEIKLNDYNTSTTMRVIWHQEHEAYRALLAQLEKETDLPVPDENPVVETYGNCPGCGRPTEGRYCPYCGWTVPDNIPTGIYDMAAITIVFDGGSRNNGSVDADAYGSYLLDIPEFGKSQVVRLTFPLGTTSNQAEYKALIAALEGVIFNIKGIGHSPKNYTVKVYGDSQLVIKQLTGEFKLRALAQLGGLHSQAVILLARFKSIDLNWWPREESVKVLGH